MSAIEDLAGDVRVNAQKELMEELARKGAVQAEQGQVDHVRFNLRRGNGQLLLTIGTPVVLMAGIAMVAFTGMEAIVEAGSPEARLAAESSARSGVLIMLGISVSVMLAAGFYLKTSIVGFATSLSGWMDQIARGETEMEITGKDRPDEFGDMARSLEVMRLGTNRLLTLTAREQRHRDQREKMRVEQEREVLDLATTFDRTVAEVVSSVAAASTQLHATASEMSRTAEQSTSQSEKVASAMEQAAEGASAAAAASDEFAMSIGEISRQAADSAELARKARGTANEADQTISALDEAANSIGQVVELISTIASRTNLLALNASIEAARGGEAGRGFAVVASEVKELASQTSRATQDVADQIQAIQQSTGASVSALRTVSGEIQQIEATAIAIASAVDQQSVAGQDLARSIDIAARHSEEVGTHVRDVRENSLRTGAAASQVLNSAGELERQASTLREQVDAFLVKIRDRAK